MKKRKKLIFTVFLLILTLSIQPIFGQLYKPSETLQSYINRAEVIQNQIRYLGQTALSNIANQRDSTELMRLINVNVDQVSALERDVQNYIRSLDPNTLESRNAIILHIALHHFTMALRELGFFLNSQTDSERFTALERYFYDHTTSQENINRIRQQL